MPPKEYLARLPSSRLAAFVDDFYYLAGIPPYPRLTIPPMPSALLVVNLGDPFRITHSATGQTLGVDGGQVLAESPAALEGI